MEDILDEDLSTVVRPEDDFGGFMNMLSKQDSSIKVDVEDNDEEDEDQPLDIPEEELPPSMRGKGKKSEPSKNDNDEDDSEEEEEVEEGDEDIPPSEDDEENDEPQDDLEVSLDTVITLPDGTSKSIEELTRDFKTTEEIKERETFLSSKEEELKERGANLDKDLALAKLEADDVIDKFKGFDWSALLAESPEEYGKAKMYVERHEKRSNEIRQLMNEREASVKEQETQALQEKAQACVTTLSKDIPGWSGELYKDILTYAIDKGTDPDVISKCTDPGILKAFYNSMKFEKGENIVKAKIKRNVSSPKRTLKASTQEQVKSKSKTSMAGFQGQEVDEFLKLQSILGNK